MESDFNELIKKAVEQSFEKLETMIGIPARVAIARHIPEKPQYVKYPWATCPTCGGSVSIESVRDHVQNGEITYCEYCGQAIDWEGSLHD